MSVLGMVRALRPAPAKVTPRRVSRVFSRSLALLSRPWVDPSLQRRWLAACW